MIVPGSAAVALAALSATRQASLDEVQDQVEFSTESVTDPEDDDGPTEPDAIGIIYARVSTDEQVGEGLESQVEELKNIAKEQDIERPYDPIRDEGKTGTNFDRDGIKQVFKFAEESKISHLLVDDLSRIGRSAPETLYFIYILSDRFGINIVTVNGPLNFGEVNGLMQTTLKTLMSHITVHERARKSLRSKIRGFVQQQNWSSSGKKIPLGYRPDGNGWLEIDEDEAEIVEDIFDIYVSTNNYEKTKDRINDRYAQRLESKLSYYRIRKILQDTVYIGNASITVNADSVDAENTSVDDPDRAILDDKTSSGFNAVSTNRTRNSRVERHRLVKSFSWRSII